MYEIHLFQLKFVYIYRNEVKIIAITYFMATSPFWTLKLQLRIDLKLVALNSHYNFASFDIFDVYFKQHSTNNISTTIFATFYFEIAVKWSKSRIKKKIIIGTCLKHLVKCTCTIW